MKKYMNMSHLYLAVIFLSIVLNCYLLIEIKIQDTYVLVKKDERDYSVIDKSTNQNIVRLIDKDGDGKVDFIYQRITDGNGKYLRDVIDYDFDGYPDTRVEMDGGGGYVWYDNNWYQVHYDKNEDRKHIVKDGITIYLTEENSLLIKWHRKLFGSPSK